MYLYIISVDLFSEHATSCLASQILTRLAQPYPLLKVIAPNNSYAQELFQNGLLHERYHRQEKMVEANDVDIYHVIYYWQYVGVTVVGFIALIVSTPKIKDASNRRIASILNDFNIYSSV